MAVESMQSMEARRSTRHLLPQLSPSAEERLLVACARLRLTSAQRNELNALAAGPLRWEQVIYKAQWQGLTALVFHHLRGLESRDMVPAQVMDQLKAVYLANGARNLHGQAELKRVLDALGNQGIPVILLKGAALAEAVYGDVGLRPMSDLDLLVPEEKALAAQAIVEGLGYRPVGTPEEQEDTRKHHRHLPGLAQIGKPALVEVHRHIVRQDSGVYFDISGFWDRAQEVIVAQRPALTLAPEDLIIHLCLNFFTDRGYRSLNALRQLCDIAESIRYYHSDLRWQLLVSNVLSYQLAGPVGCVLYLAQGLLDAPIPESAARRLWPQGFGEAQVKSFLRRRVLDTREWAARSLIRPEAEYRPAPVALAALRRLIPSRRYLARQRQASTPGMPVYRLYLGRIWQGFGILCRAAARPHETREDLSIDYWLHSLLPRHERLS